MSAQLKVLVERFCAINSSVTRKNMKSALLAAAYLNRAKNGINIRRKFYEGKSDMDILYQA